MDLELIAFLKYVHGTFNIIVFILFCVQGWLGFTLRRSRKLGLKPVPKNTKRHRRNGPIVALLGLCGVGGGLTVGFVSHLAVEHPHNIVHLSLAFILTLLIVCTYLSSKKIKGTKLPWRTNHALLGLSLVGLYCIQVTIGLGILL